MSANISQRRKWLNGAIIGVTVIVLALMATVVISAGATYSTGDWEEIAEDRYNTPWVREEQLAFGDSGDRWAALNEAIQNKDREAVLSFASGEAVEQLELWWENTTKIGWETAYIVPRPRYVDEGPEFEVMAGADLGFPAIAPRGEGNPDAGLLLTQAFPYVVTAEEEGEDLTITSFTPVQPMPWDEEGMHVARRDHVVLYGAGEEADFIDSRVDQAEKDAVAALEAIAELESERFLEGFAVAVTNDADRYDQWRQAALSENSELLSKKLAEELGVFTVNTARPPMNEAVFPEVAVKYHPDGGRGGVVTVVGPEAFDLNNWSFGHEFGHVLQLTARNPYLRPLPPNASEGFAQFFADLAGIADVHVDDHVKEQIAAEGTDALNLYRVDDRDDPNSIPVAYVSAASYFKFLLETSGDPWDVALRVSDETEEDLPQIVDDMDPNFSVWEWQAWVEEL